MNNRLLVWAIGTVFLFSACKKQTIPLTSAANPANTHEVNTRNLAFEGFSARGRMALEEADGNKLASNLTIRIRKDSIIWASVVPGLGIEVARLRITPDSVHLMNRLNKTFFAGDYSLLREKFKVDVNFAMVQAILLGNFLPGGPGQDKAINEPPLQHLSRQQGTLLIDQFLNLTDGKLKKLTVKDLQTQNTLQVDYSNFETVENNSFPRTARIVVQQNNGNETKGTIAELEYNRISLNEAGMTFPFAIPQGYTRK